MIFGLIVKEMSNFQPVQFNMFCKIEGLIDWVAKWQCLNKFNIVYDLLSDAVGDGELSGILY